MEGSSYYPSDSKLTFKILLDKNKTVSINRKNLQALATKIFKAKLDISPEILKKNYFLFINFSLIKNSVCFGKESFSSLEPWMWNLVPDSFKNESHWKGLKIGKRLGTLINARFESVRYIPVK